MTGLQLSFWHLPACWRYRPRGERAGGFDLGGGPRGFVTPVCQSRACVCVCVHVFAEGPRGGCQRPSLRITPWGSLVRGHGMGLSLHPLTRLNRFAWEGNAQKTVGMCPQMTQERLLGLLLPQVEAATRVVTAAPWGICRPSGVPSQPQGLPKWKRRGWLGRPEASPSAELRQLPPGCF